MIGRLVTRSPRAILAVSAVWLVLAVALTGLSVERLSLNRFEAPGSESVAARTVLAERHDTGAPNVVLLVEAREGTVDDPDVARTAADLSQRLRDSPDVVDTWSYWSERESTMRSRDGTKGLIFAVLPGSADHVRQEVLPELERTLRLGADAPVRLTIGGADEVFRVFAAQARADFLRAELIIIPLVLVLLWLAYRRLAPAALTLGVGVLSACTSLAALGLINTVIDISTFAANISLVMGIGLGVDYGLLVVHRFREESGRGGSRAEAVRRTVAGAGRTVAFSGATVAAGMAALLLFPFPFISSFAYAGITVVAAAILSATVALPAALMLWGPRVIAGRTPPSPTASLWHRIPTAVMRRPLVLGGLGLGAVLLLAAPAAGITFGTPDDRQLSSSHAVRGMYDTIREDFPTEDADAVLVVPSDRAPSTAQLERYAQSLRSIPGAERVDVVEDSWLRVVPTGERLADDPLGLVHDVRDLESPTPMLVGGYMAEIADYRQGVVDRLPLVAVLVVASTLVLLFLMTGSLLAPIKATVLNALSLGVMAGVVTWAFQDGGLAGPLGFTPVGLVEPSVVLLMMCVGYGLSMDYEVFLLARIREEYLRTGDPVTSVLLGIARSAPLVTTAAVILAVSFGVYASSDIVMLQQLGIGMAVAILVDATLIRGALVPALMRLAGHGNWWAPPRLRRWHDTFGLPEASASALPPSPVTSPERV